jgi:hypothetical protein
MPSLEKVALKKGLHHPHRDVRGVHRVLTGLDHDSIGMREVSPMGGLLSEVERMRALWAEVMRRDQLEPADRAEIVV